MADAAPLQLLELPHDVLLLIVELLGARDIMRCAATCRAMYRLTSDDALWRRLCFRRFRLAEAPVEVENLGWKYMYMRREQRLGRLYTWGSGGDNRLGIGRSSTELEPLCTDDNNLYSDVACGWRWTLCMRQRQPYAFGGSFAPVPTPVPGVRHLDLVQASCSCATMLALDSGGRVFSWTYQDSLYNSSFLGCEPAQVELDDSGDDVRATQIATCGDICLALSERNELFGWGGAFGFVPRRMHPFRSEAERALGAELSPPPIIERIFGGTGSSVFGVLATNGQVSLINTSNALPCVNPVGLEAITVRSMRFGVKTQFVITDTDDLLELAISNRPWLSTPPSPLSTPTEAIATPRSISSSPGAASAAALLPPGTLFVHASPIAMPREPGEAEAPRVAAVDAGNVHMLALDRDGRVFSWGLNSLGECGLGHQHLVRAPTQVPRLAPLFVKAISAGMFHSAAIAE